MHADHPAPWPPAWRQRFETGTDDVFTSCPAVGDHRTTKLWQDSSKAEFDLLTPLTLLAGYLR